MQQDAAAAQAWRWVALGQLWMIAAFAGLSLVVIAMLSFLHGGAGHGVAELFATAVGGALLMLLAWRGVVRMLQRLEHDEPGGPGPGARGSPRGSLGADGASAPGLAP